MKRAISLLLAVLLMAAVFPMNIFASNDETIQFADGSYIVVSVFSAESRASQTKTGSKSYTFYGEDNVAEWKAVLTGSFTYTGSSSTCTSSSCNVTVYDSAWYTISKSSGKSGASATADITMGKKLFGVTVREVPISIVLSCDANGKLS